MNGLMLRRQAMMAGKAEPAPAGPLYSFPNGTYYPYQSRNGKVNKKDITISNGNHVYFFKRWGDNALYYIAPISWWTTAPFTLKTGDVIRTVIKPTSSSTGAGLKVFISTTAADLSATPYEFANQTDIITKDFTNMTEGEATVTLGRDYDNPTFCCRATANTSSKTWAYDIEIYVNGTRYI